MDASDSGSCTKPHVLLAPVNAVGVKNLVHSRLADELRLAGARVTLVLDSGISENPAGRDVPVIHAARPARSKTAAGRLRERLFGRVEALASYLKDLGMGGGMNTAVLDSSRPYRKRSVRRAGLGLLLPLLDVGVAIMRRSRFARRLFSKVWSLRHRPWPAHVEIVRRDRPDLVVVSSPGWWEGDESLIRASRARNVPTVAVICGWDHTSNKGLPGVLPDRILAWSDEQKAELVLGSDVRERDIGVAGPPYMDVFRNAPDPMTVKEVLARLNLDPERPIVLFVASFAGLSSNVGMIERLARAVEDGEWPGEPQLVVRLHPAHVDARKRLRGVLQREVAFFDGLAERVPDVHIDRPQIRPGEGTTQDDLNAAAALVYLSSVVVTLFSTMVLEALAAGKPVVTAAIDPPAEWRHDDTLSITEALDWPTHFRPIRSGATTVARTYDEMIQGVATYLVSPETHGAERGKFFERETAGSAGKFSATLASRLLELSEEAQDLRVNERCSVD